MILHTKDLPVTGALLEEVRVPPNFWSVQVKGVPCETTRGSMHALLKSMPNWISTNQGVFIGGRFCSGKTAFACMLLREAIGYSASCLFVYAAEAPDLWRQTNPLSGNAFSEDFRRVDLLVLDDYGQEDTITKFDSVKKIEFVIRARYDACKPTILTTNFRLPELLKRHEPMFGAVLRRALPQTLTLHTNFLGGGQ